MNHLKYIKEGYNRVEFDAEGGQKLNEAYINYAQRFNEALKQLMGIAYDYNHVVAISRFVARESASLYLRLNVNFETKGAEEKKEGITEYQIGELYGIPIFKSLDKESMMSEAVAVMYTDKENNEGMIGAIYINNIRGINSLDLISVETNRNRRRDFLIACYQLLEKVNIVTMEGVIQYLEWEEVDSNTVSGICDYWFQKAMLSGSRNSLHLTAAGIDHAEALLVEKLEND
jgi:hypothetical protein